MNEIDLIIDRLTKITSNTDTRWDWEDLLSIKFDDKRAEALRLLFWQVSDVFHGAGSKTYSPEGLHVLKAILDALNKEGQSK